MARRRRSKVIRNFTDKTALDTVVKASERISELEANITKLRTALEKCRDFLNTGPPGDADEWTALRNVVNGALGEGE
ncbi:hypothetical protein H8E77_38130 [bacterium]|nr:hypothetical protein [bacterium]